MAMHVSGPVISSSGNFITVPMPRSGGTHAAASGTTVPAWRIVLPPVATAMNAAVMSFAGGPSAPQGGTFKVKLWSNGARKGLLSASVAGASTSAVTFGALTYTFPASAVVRATVDTVGGTAAGGGGQLTFYMRQVS